MLTHVDLFSGIGGFALAAQWAGFRTIAFCEIEPFCQEVLKVRLGAVADAESRETQPTESGRFHPKFGGKDQPPLLISDIHAFDGTQFRGATLLTGGVPCQPASIAGKRKGTADDRWLWPEAIRVLAEVKPTWAIFENPPGILSLEQGVVFEDLLSQMEGKGYEVRPIIIPACAVNAPHRRDRVWIVGHSGKSRRQQNSRGPHEDEGKNEGWPKIQGNQPSGSDSDAPDAERFRCQVGEWVGDGKRRGQEQEGTHAPEGSWDIPWIEVATRLCRVDAGVSNRVDRLKALGNAIVPQVAYQIIKAISEIEGMSI